MSFEQHFVIKWSFLNFENMFFCSGVILVDNHGIDLLHPSLGCPSLNRIHSLEEILSCGILQFKIFETKVGGEIRKRFGDWRH